MCPGISMALQVVGLTLASFLHAFNVQMPEDKAVDMEEAIGLTNIKATPLEVLVTSRVPEHAFDVQMAGDKAVDLEEAIGLTNLKATPLEVLSTPWVPEHVYYV
ncbi:hypothetical protein CDL15_Pgr006817 [Punica granatum]|uniref:Uncharacterized protein n=1 Tax=Punica granatum TaxID=22663 RepID=A0A218X755_PUNGR|nr:hypothetical protein CDL15_Pgr006817 [Punica granatum]